MAVKVQSWFVAAEGVQACCLTKVFGLSIFIDSPRIADARMQTDTEEARDSEINPPT